jgi:hypothetical protein
MVNMGNDGDVTEVCDHGIVYEAVYETCLHGGIGRITKEVGSAGEGGK